MSTNKFKSDETPKKKKQALKPVENFFALRARYSFLYDIIDNDKDSPNLGKKVFVTDENNHPVYNTRGKLKVIQKSEVFKVVSEKMSAGFLSTASYDPNTEDPQEIVRGERLREISKRPDIFMYDEETHQKHSNFAAWSEAQKVQNLQDKVKTLEQRIADAEGK